MARKTVKLIRENDLLAEVTVEMIEDETGCSPYVSEGDVLKLDRVRLAPRRGDIPAAARAAKVFVLMPVSA